MQLAALRDAEETEGSLNADLLGVGEGGEDGEKVDTHKGDDSRRTGTQMSSFYNLAGTIMGSSSLSMPFAASNAGIGVFVSFICVMGVIAQQSAVLIVRASELSRKSTYAEIGRAAYGRWGELGVVVGVLIQQLGASVAIQRVQGDVLGPIVARVPNAAFSQAYPWQILLAAFVILPLAMLRRIDALRYSSMVALWLVLLFSVVIIVDGCSSVSHPLPQVQHEKPHAAPPSFVDALLALPLISFAFTCHQNVPSIWRELQQPTMARFRTISLFSFAACGAIYILSGVLGYVAFRSLTESDIIDSYSQLQRSDTRHGVPQGAMVVPAGVVRAFQAGIGVALTLSYPIIAFELRHSIEEVIEIIQHGQVSSKEHDTPVNLVRHVAIVTTMVIITTTLAITVDSVGTVFGFVGATSAPFIVFILPALFVLKLDADILPGGWDKIKIYAILIIGILLIPFCLAAEIVKAVNPDA